MGGEDGAVPPNGTSKRKQLRYCSGDRDPFENSKSHIDAIQVDGDPWHAQALQERLPEMIWHTAIQHDLGIERLIYSPELKSYLPYTLLRRVYLSAWQARTWLLRNKLELV